MLVMTVFEIEDGDADCVLMTEQGTVILVANEGAHIDLPDGTVLEDKVVTGNLRILDH